MKPKDNFPIKGWKWIFYVLGWISGVLNIIFWIIMIILHLAKDKGEKFFNSKFHERVYYWGLIITILLLVLISIGIIWVVIQNLSVR